MATRKFTDPWLRGLKVALGLRREEWFDEGEVGLVASVNSKRRVTFWLFARYPRSDGQVPIPSRRVLGDFSPADGRDRVFIVKKGVQPLTLDGARQKARDWKALIAAGIDPGAPEPEPAPVETVGVVFREFFGRHVKKEGQKDGRGAPIPPLRSSSEIERIFNKYILADLNGNDRWRNIPITNVKRSDVTKLLNDVQDLNGAAQADAVLAQLSKLFNSYAAGKDDFVSPIVKGMRRTKPKERARKRVLGDSKELADAEIRVFWEACGREGIFGAFCRFALLTGQRRAKILWMRWNDLSGDGLWTISAEDREKGNAEFLFLSPLAFRTIKALPRTKGNEFVFQGAKKGPINGFTKSKARLDAGMIELAGNAEIAHWVLHDLRRTAKTLMMRAGVSSHDSERVLGHEIGGVEGTYDRYAYLKEKRVALRKLAALVQRIAKPPSSRPSESGATGWQQRSSNTCAVPSASRPGTTGTLR